MLANLRFNFMRYISKILAIIMFFGAVSLVSANALEEYRTRTASAQASEAEQQKVSDESPTPQQADPKQQVSGQDQTTSSSELVGSESGKSSLGIPQTAEQITPQHYSIQRSQSEDDEDVAEESESAHEIDD